MTLPTRPFGPLRTQVPVVGQGTWNMEARGSLPVI